MTSIDDKSPAFFLTAPKPCPYLENQFERKVFTTLKPSIGLRMNSAMSNFGFRRSQDILYRPLCENCDACISVRIVVEQFLQSASFRRIEKKNLDLKGIVKSLRATEEQFTLFKQYQDYKHLGGGMSEMIFPQYQQMIEESCVQTVMLEYRATANNDLHKNGPLYGVALTDILEDGLSMVYSFYDVTEPHRSLGTFMILDHIMRAREMNLPYLYLGYWVRGSRKMDYKNKFQPLEYLIKDRWQRLDSRR